MNTVKKPVITIDFGGVYFTSARYPVTKKFSKKFNIPQKKIIDVLIGPNWTAYAEGRSDGKTYWKHVSDRLKISQKQTQDLRHGWYNYMSPQDGMPQLVKRLKKKYAVVALSSIETGWTRVIEKKYKVSKIFHEQHYSYHYGIDKPDAKFFISAAKKMNTKPENCIVIDDNKKFLQNVRKTGARTILFRNARQLERDLRKLGVEI